MSEKRAHNSDNEDSNDDWYGPKQTENENDEKEAENLETKVIQTPNEDHNIKVKKRKSEYLLQYYFIKLQFFYIYFFALKDEELEKLYLQNLPNAENYEKSFMHRETITHLVVTV